jgi:hypothetical protein
MFRRHLPVRPGVQVETVQKKSQKGHSAKGGSMRSKADPVVSRGRGTSDSLANCEARGIMRGALQGRAKHVSVSGSVGSGLQGIE